VVVRAPEPGLLSPAVEPELRLLSAAERQNLVAPADLLRLLYRQVRALAGPRRDLDDLVQNAAERALRSLHRFEGRSQLSTWTYGVAYRTLLDHDRWYRRYRRRFAYTDEHSSPEPASVHDSESALMELARARKLHAALARLPATKRAVVVMHDLEGIDVRDIATVVGANERTVRSRLRDGRKKLLSMLAGDPLFDAEVRA
jgi:RNA polymerase sigma-70 factor (ECF subfamily)